MLVDTQMEGIHIFITLVLVVVFIIFFWLYFRMEKDKYCMYIWCWFGLTFFGSRYKVGIFWFGDVTVLVRNFFSWFKFLLLNNYCGYGREIWWENMCACDVILYDEILWGVLWNLVTIGTRFTRMLYFKHNKIIDGYQSRDDI